jgi:hypothetical protein
MKIKLFIVTLVAGIGFVLFFRYYPRHNTDNSQNTAGIKKEMSTEQCYYRSTAKTEKEPFSVEEYIQLKFNGDAVTGTKFGFQDGPGYSNGYNGSLSGIKNSSELTLDYSYTVEGSKNVEQEIYTVTDKGIEKMQYKLIEKNGKLVPDKSSLVKNISYSPFSCAEFTKKVPQ